ncbi:MAG: hypothetical protein AAGK01_12295 [Pseudomonadota bacterium]
MKAIHLKLVGAMALGLSACGCVPSVDAPITPSAPVATPAPAPAPTPTPAPPPVVEEPRFENYLDAPQTVGTWGYGADPDTTMAFFGNGGNELAASFVVLCRVGTGEVWLGRRGADSSRTMEIKTETVTRLLRADLMRREGSIVVAKLSANDPLLDAMAITKGRFAVGVERLRTLYLPAWAEVTRVIEDCR